MVIKGKIEYKKAIILNSKFCKDLEKLLLNYCNELDYSAEILDNSSIRFDSLDETLNYDNYGKGKIKSLRITGFKNYNIIFTIVFESKFEVLSFIGYNETFKCTYNFKDKKDELIFKNEISNLLEKNKAGYWFIAKLKLWSIFCFISVILTFYNLFTGYSISENTNAMVLIIAIVISIAFIILINVIDYYIIRRLLPPIVFAWGIEESKNSRNTVIRNCIFWSVIVAFFVSIAASSVFSLFSTGGTQ